jgi:3-oxoacyl-[acyl-carrier protein] reductase
VTDAARAERRSVGVVDRAVLVTGASRGIGAAIAQRFARDGDRIAVHYAGNRDKAEAVHHGLDGDGHTIVQGDVGDPQDVERFVTEAATELGDRIDVLVNNAGIFVAHDIESDDYSAWQREFQRTIDVNLIGPANVTFQALRHIPDGGRIVNISSRGAFRGEPGQPAYGASKAGLNAFGQSIARKLAHRNIAVTSVAPGFVETDMAQEALSGPKGEARRKESPFGRVATPEEIAAAVFALAQPDMTMASGSVIDVNGASYLRI